MRKASDEPLQKCTMDLFASDVAELKRLHGNYGVATVVRRLVREHIRVVRARVEPEPSPELEID